jgi:hypothetical protein
LHRRDYWRAVRSNQPFDGVDRPLRLFVLECEIVSLVLLEMDTATHQPATPQKKGRRRRFGVFFNEEEEEKICVALLLPTKKKEINNKSKFQAPRRKAFIKETVDTRAKIVALSTIEPTDVNSRARVARIFRVFDKNKRERKKEKRKAPLVHFCVSLR